jgi:acyl-CoA thioester hydrolase
VRVYYEDTDAGGVVYFTNHLRFMERARTEWLRSLGFDQSELRQRHGILFVVKGIETNYLKPARLDDALTVQSCLVLPGRVVLRFEQTVERSGDTLVRGTSDVACVSAASLRPCRIPTVVMQALHSVAGAAIPQRPATGPHDRAAEPAIAYDPRQQHPTETL